MKEIVKSIPMMTFVIFVLGLITIDSISEMNKKKDLEPTIASSQIIHKK